MVGGGNNATKWRASDRRDDSTQLRVIVRIVIVAVIAADIVTLVVIFFVITFLSPPGSRHFAPSLAGFAREFRFVRVVAFVTGMRELSLVVCIFSEAQEAGDVRQLTANKRR